MLEQHTIEHAAGSVPQRGDRLVVAVQQAVANLIGGGAGQSVNVDVTGLELPASYSVVVDPHQDATWYTTNHTAAGFRIVLSPRLAASTLAAGTVDFIVIA